MKARKKKLEMRDSRSEAQDHRVRVIAYCLRAGRKPPTGMTKAEHEAAMKLLETLCSESSPASSSPLP